MKISTGVVLSAFLLAQFSTLLAREAVENVIHRANADTQNNARSKKKVLAFFFPQFHEVREYFIHRR